MELQVDGFVVDMDCDPWAAIYAMRKLLTERDKALLFRGNIPWYNRPHIKSKRGWYAKQHWMTFFFEDDCRFWDDARLWFCSPLNRCYPLRAAMRKRYRWKLCPLAPFKLKHSLLQVDRPLLPARRCGRHRRTRLELQDDSAIGS